MSNSQLNPLEWGIQKWYWSNFSLSWNKNIITNIYKIEACYSIMCRYFWIGFADFMLKVKSLLDYTNLLSPSEYKRSDNNIKIFPIEYKQVEIMKRYFNAYDKYREPKDPKKSYIF